MNYSFTIPPSLVIECSILGHDSLLVKCECASLLFLNQHCNVYVYLCDLCLRVCGRES